MEEKRQTARAARATKDEEDTSHPNPGDGFDREQELAATKIQSRVRGKQARPRAQGSDIMSLRLTRLIRLEARHLCKIL